MGQVVSPIEPYPAATQLERDHTRRGSLELRTLQAIEPCNRRIDLGEELRQARVTSFELRRPVASEVRNRGERVVADGPYLVAEREHIGGEAHLEQRHGRDVMLFGVRGALAQQPGEIAERVAENGNGELIHAEYLKTRAQWSR